MCCVDRLSQRLTSENLFHKFLYESSKKNIFSLIQLKTSIWHNSSNTKHSFYKFWFIPSEVTVVLWQQSCLSYSTLALNSLMLQGQNYCCYNWLIHDCISNQDFLILVLELKVLLSTEMGILLLISQFVPEIFIIFSFLVMQDLIIIQGTCPEG